MSTTRIPRFLGCALAALAALGCASDAGDDAGDDDGPGGGLPPLDGFVFPAHGHTGFSGADDFKLPVGVTLDGDVAWQVADPAIVSLEEVAPPDQATVGLDAWAMLTSLAPGMTTVTAEAGERKLTATIVVFEYAAADVAAGAARYNDDDGSGSPDRVPCASCHLQPGGADHSPLEVSVHPDEDLLAAITTGQYPSGKVLEGVDHTWAITEAERVGIVAYLRTLPPRGF